MTKIKKHSYRNHNIQKLVPLEFGLTDEYIVIDWGISAVLEYINLWCPYLLPLCIPSNEHLQNDLHTQKIEQNLPLNAAIRGQ